MKTNQKHTMVANIKHIVMSVILILLISFPAYAESTNSLPDTYLGDYYGPGMQGWQQNETGWVYYNQGQKIMNSWGKVGEYWYYFNQDGTMLTGWITLGDKQYYLSQVKTERYPLGACYIDDVTPDMYKVDVDGVKTNLIHPNPYGYSCVEVDITNQMVYLFKDDTLLAYGPCVTGYKGVHDTGVGHYYIQSKERNRYLQGTNDNGTKYKSYVNFWMPFNGGQGLHDASWRGTTNDGFGGGIYIYDGSHGCVNMPYSLAETIYNNCTVGMPVITHL